MKRAIRLGNLFLIVVLGMSCGGPSTPPPDTEKPSSTQVVSVAPTIAATPEVPSRESKELLAAEWMGGKILVSQVDHILGSRLAQIVEGVTGEVRLKEILLKERKLVLDTLIDNYLLIQEAHNRNLQLSDVQKEQILKQVRSKFDTKEQYEESLQKAGQSEEDLLRVMTNIELGKQCVEEEKARLSEQITPQSLREYYDLHISDRFTPPARSDINWVMIKQTEKRTLEEAKNLATRLHEEVQAKLQGLDKLDERRKVIQDYASQYSDHVTGKYNYGFINLYHGVPGWDKFDPEFRKSLETLTKPGEFSPVLKIDGQSYGFYLVYNFNPSRVSLFESKSVQDMLPNMVLFEKMEEWRNNLKKNFGLILYEENLSIIPDSIPSASAP